MDMTKHDVISAFLDDEPFSADELGVALSDPAGRELLLDLVALRHLVQPAADMRAAITTSTRRSAFRTAFAAAAVIVAMVGGYVVGQRQDRPGVSEAPAATRVVEPQSSWEDVPIGRMR
jgi:hypothetical protein